MNKILLLGHLLHSKLEFGKPVGGTQYFTRSTPVVIVNDNEHGLRKLVRTAQEPHYFGWVGNELIGEAVEPITQAMQANGQAQV